ncbi:MAG TPA: NAD(P)H-dependent oxidoreductase [Segetibacter sp.]|nr:NAD(P)H-dependent oxidoreductase [Segetibacter sp.]
MKIEIISGSPRLASVTKRVAIHLYNALSGLDGLEVGLIDVRNYILPPVETVFSSIDDAPEELQTLASRIFNADAFILVTPEYNGSYSPAMKNLLDHFPKQKRKVFGIVTASPGAMGGMRAAMQVQQLIYGLSGIGSPQMLIVPEVDKKFSSDGKLQDSKFSKQVNGFIDEFLWLAESLVQSAVAA